MRIPGDRPGGGGEDDEQLESLIRGLSTPAAELYSPESPAAEEPPPVGISTPAAELYSPEYMDDSSHAAESTLPAKSKFVRDPSLRNFEWGCFKFTLRVNNTTGTLSWQATCPSAAVK